MRNLTGSSLPIFKHCGYSFRDDVAVPSLRTAADESAGGEGHSLHEHIADTIEGKAQYGDDPETPAIISQVMQRIGDDKILDYESAWAWSPATGKARKLGTRINREYERHGATPEDICLTLDLVLLRQSELVVVDFKSGYGTHTDAVEDNWQLLGGALALLDEATDRDLSIRTELWYPRVDRVWVESTPVSLFELEKFKQDLLARLKALPRAVAIAGEHCRYCRACGACPATEQAILGFKSMGLDVEGNYRWSTEIADVGHAEWMLDRLTMVKQAVELIETSLKKFSDTNNGIATSDGKVWRAVAGKRQGLNMPAVKRFLGERLPEFTTTHEFNSYRKVKK